jgi:hypothetical protein
MIEKRNNPNTTITARITIHNIDLLLEVVKLRKRGACRLAYRSIQTTVYIADSRWTP